MSIRIDSDIAELLDKRGIRLSDVQKVIAFANETGNVFKNRVSGRRLTYHRPSKTTFWIECEQAGESCRLFNAYSHRMQILEALNMPAGTRGQDIEWVCVKCNALLEPATVKLAYLDEIFAANIPACPSCQRVFVSEKDAVERMALAEKMLEDK